MGKRAANLFLRRTPDIQARRSSGLFSNRLVPSLFEAEKLEKFEVLALHHLSRKDEQADKEVTSPKRRRKVLRENSLHESPYLMKREDGS